MFDWNSKPLNLNNAEQLGRGITRKAYRHPDNPNLVVKVARNKLKKRLASRPVKRYAIWRYGAYRDWQKEYTEYLAYIARHDELPSIFAPLYGFVQTDRGVGMVVGLLGDLNGRPAPSLRDYLQDGGSFADVLPLINAFFAEMRRTRVVISDLHIKNVAIIENKAKERRLVSFDGLGDDSVLPLRSWSRWAHSHWVTKQHKKMIEAAKKHKRRV